jgi:CRP-like cAMP-binding protein
VRGGPDDRRIPGLDGPLADDGGTDLITADPIPGEQFTANRDNVIVHRPDFWGLLGEADRKDLISAARSRVFPPGGMLCSQGEPTTHVFILQSGWVKVFTDTSDGRQTLEALRREGEIVGEIAGQVTGYRTATVQALGPVHALLIGIRQLGEFLDSRPVAAQAYRQAMAEVQQVAYEKQRSRDLLSGAQRLAGLLLDLTEQPSLPRPHGQPDRDAAAPQLQLSQEELASLIGASRSTVTRALQGWRSRHIIGTDQRRIQILDRARLRRIADRDSGGQSLARGKPVALSNTSHERGPLSR